MFWVGLSPVWAASESAIPPTIEPCMKTLAFEPSTSLLEHIRKMGVALSDFPEIVHARTIQPGVDRPLDGLGLGATGETLFWVANDGQAVVDDRLFSTLKVVAIPLLSPGDIIQVGTWKQPVVGGHEAIAVLLMRVGIILTYVHSGSDLCIRSGGTENEFHIRGTHTYFTNEENTDSVDFFIRFSRSGRIEVGRSKKR